jgi:phospholipid/cholesterol/gamma-HCH transport system substrate-binding protein
MKNSLETRLGVFVILVVLAAWAIVETLGGVEMFHGGYHVSALFDTAQDLKIGDSVKMAGVEIGRVEKIALDEANNKVSVTMKLHSDAIVRTDSKAIIKFTGLMGQYFVSLDFGSSSSPKVLDGAVLASEEQPDLSAMMAKLDKAATGIQNLTQSFTPDTINNLMGPLVDFVKQNSAPLTATIANIKNVSSQIAAGQGTIGKLIYEDSLYNSALTTVSNLQDTAASAKDVLASAKQTMNKVNAGQGTIGKLLTDDTLYNSTTASMTNLNQILLKINQGQGTVGKLVNDQEFYKNAKLSLQKLDKAADSLEDQGPISVLGILANNLF